MFFTEGEADILCDDKQIHVQKSDLLIINSNEKDISSCVNSIILEYNNKEPSYEISIKSYVYRLFTILLRNHMDKVLNYSAFKGKAKNAERLELVLKYIDQNYFEKLSIDVLSTMINISKFRFCHIFKETTGKSPGQYINSVRISKAGELLKTQTLLLQKSLTKRVLNPLIISVGFLRNTKACLLQKQGNN